MDTRTEPPVYVPLAELMALEGAAAGLQFSAARRLASVLAGQHGSRLRGRGLDFAELRRYVPGDDLRQLDARASLRLGKAFVRSYTEERDRPVMLAVDQRMDMYFGSVRAFKCAVAARLAALSAWTAYRHGDRVGGVVLADTGLTTLRPLRSRAQVQALLAAVARENAALSARRPARDATGRLNEALAWLAAHAPHDGLICVISDFAGADDETLRRLRQLSAHNDVIAMLVSDPLARALPDRGRVWVSQGEAQVELPLGRASVRTPLADTAARRLDAVAQWLRRAQVPLLPFTTAEAPLAQLRRGLGGGRP